MAAGSSLHSSQRWCIRHKCIEVHIILAFCNRLSASLHIVIMDRHKLLLCSVVVSLMILIAAGEGRKKKVVIHVPYKVKKIKHTHTVYKTIHHHHRDRHPHETSHHEIRHLPATSEEHEHFHHMHIHEEPSGQNLQHLQTMNIPEFLPPDVQMELPIDIPDLPFDIASAIPKRHIIPLFRRL